jgi:Zn-dependent protease
VLLALPWFCYRLEGVLAAVIASLAYTFVLLAHEVGHALMARWREVEVYSIRLFVVHGQCEHAVPYYEHDDVWIAWGGVAAQALIIGVAWAAQFVLRGHIGWNAWQYIAPLFHALIAANFSTLIVNLVPVAPLDGKTAWRAIPLLREFIREKRRQKTRRKPKKTEKELVESSQKIVADAIEKLRNKY